MTTVKTGRSQVKGREAAEQRLASSSQSVFSAEKSQESFSDPEESNQDLIQPLESSGPPYYSRTTCRSIAKM